MFPPKRILFPIDFSDRCNAVVPTAEAFARQFDAQLSFLHVNDPLHLEGVPVGGDALEAFAARAEFRGLKSRTFTLTGDPAAQIVEFAHDCKIDLILMPTHGYGLFRRFLLGSVTQKVLHDAWCPVWTSAHSETLDPLHEPRFRSIVCAVDLSHQSHPTLQWAWNFAKATDAKIVIVHAVPLLATYGVEYVQADWQREISDAALRQIDCLQRAEHTFAPVDIVVGETAGAIRQAAEDAKADLVVIGRSIDEQGHGRLRTHAYPIIRHSPCPVVSV
ncbi:MAG TPA: universal stress protein [Bryobacteraceae bacterium]|nr:universal stress protein [Bryobacteraceae bacterium]